MAINQIPKDEYRIHADQHERRYSAPKINEFWERKRLSSRKTKNAWQST